MTVTLPWPPKDLIPNARRFWTEIEIEELRLAYANGGVVNVALIAEKFQRSKYSVHVKASRLGFGDYSRKKVEARKNRRKFKSPEEVAANMSKVQKELILNRGHPRHMKGKHHSIEAKLKISAASVSSNAKRTPEQKVAYLVKAMKTKLQNGTYVQERPNASWKAGWREIGGIPKYYRSKWEANYAYYLQWLKSNGQIADWEHEPTTFWFTGVKRGCVSYLPDFLVKENDGSEAYHEVKGWMDDKSKTKIRRMAKYHPTVKLSVIDSKGYAALKKSVSLLVPGWEP